MNEQRKSFRDYSNPHQTKHQLSVEELIAFGNTLLKHRNLLVNADKFYIDNVLHRQLNKRNARIPNSVLRSIEKRFLKIQKQLER